VEIRAGVPEDKAALEVLTYARCPHNEPWVLDTVFSDAMNVDAIVVATDDGGPVGWAFTGNVPGTPTDHRTLLVVVAATHEGQGVGRALFDRVRESVPVSATELRTRVYDDDERGLAVSRHWGFEIVQRSMMSALELVPGPGPQPADGVTLEEADGLVFADEEAVEAMFAASQTNPEATNSHRMTLAEIRGYVLPGERGLACVARVDGVPAALCFVILDAQGAEGNVVYTGVDPRFRGRGLGSLVKQAVQHRAQVEGVRRFATENEEHNEGIRRLNAELGFVVQWGVYRMKKDLTGASTAPA
jgi:GNAT superfamily N-acetyltransferase